MHREEIKYSLRVTGSSLAQLARENDVSRSTMSKVAANQVTTLRLRTAIANAMDKEVSEIWPAEKGELI